MTTTPDPESLMKMLQTFLCGILLCSGLSSFSQVLSNSGPTSSCGPTVSGTLTVSNYSQVVQWEIGDYELGVFVVDQIYAVTTPTFAYSINLTRAFRAKVTNKTYSNVLDTSPSRFYRRYSYRGCNTLSNRGRFLNA